LLAGIQVTFVKPSEWHCTSCRKGWVPT
jgi:hypothetical protein